jgi:hypothetical protein
VSPYIEHISLSLGVHVTILHKDATSTAWAQMEAMLADAHFARLKRLVLDFKLRGTGEPHAYRAAIPLVQRRWLLSNGAANEKRYQLDLRFGCGAYELEEIRDIVSAGNLPMIV